MNAWRCRQALGRLQGSQEEEVVVVTGVGGTDDRTSSHKHASHTKGGTVDAAVVESLTKGDAGALLSTRALSPSFCGPFESLMRVLLAAGRITPLYTVDHKGSRKQDGAQKKYYGSYLIKLRRR